MGVSGSGKSTLINNTLYELAAKTLNGAQTDVAPFKEVKGMDLFDKVVNIPDFAPAAWTAYHGSFYYGLWGSTRGVGNNVTKDYFLEDASFVRLRNVSLSKLP